MFQTGHPRVRSNARFPAIHTDQWTGKTFWPGELRTRCQTAEFHPEGGGESSISGLQASFIEKLGGNRLQFSYYTMGVKIHQTALPSLSPAGIFAYDFGATTKPRTNSGHRTVVGRSNPRSSGPHFRALRDWRTHRGNPTARSSPNPIRMLTALSPMVCSFDPHD